MAQRAGGGTLMDVGCYCVNMARLMIGTEPAEVQAMADLGTGSAVDSLGNPSLLAGQRWSS